MLSNIYCVLTEGSLSRFSTESRLVGELNVACLLPWLNASILPFSFFGVRGDMLHGLSFGVVFSWVFYMYWRLRFCMW